MRMLLVQLVLIIYCCLLLQKTMKSISDIIFYRIWDHQSLQHKPIKLQPKSFSISFIARLGLVSVTQQINGAKPNPNPNTVEYFYINIF